MKRCPQCGLLVDERHRYCGCGYDWADPEPTTWERARYRLRHRPRRWVTALPCAAAIVLLLVLTPIGCVVLWVLATTVFR